MITLTENSLITSNLYETQPLPDVTVVPEPTFQALRELVFGTDETDAILTLTAKKGTEYVRLRSYAGLLAVSDGTQFEILPKIGTISEARSALLIMLRYLRHSPFRTLPNARTGATQLPLWDVFVSSFLDALEPLVRQGMQKSYVSVEANERYWKGRFQATRQQRDNGQHADRLAVRYDALTADVPPNRILKTALLFLSSRVASTTNQQRIRHLLWAMDDVPASESLVADRQALERTNRLFARYAPALRWAIALLGERAYGVQKGRVTDQSLLFPMQRVFEDYVAHGIRTYWPEGGTVSVQESSAHLVDEHVGLPKFKLRPDMLIRQNGRTLLLDTKWKVINGHDQTGTYGIEQPDLYQLYAYGKKYEADDLFLVYPANDTFREPLAWFGYDATTRLHVVPFDPTEPLAQEVEKLAQYALGV